MHNSSEDKIVQRIWRALSPKIIKLIETNMRACVKRVPAFVVASDNDSRMADVQLMIGDEQIMSLKNCSGQNLRSGDNVWIDFMYSMDNAYISIKNDGKSWGW